MALPSSGALSLLNIQNEFGGASPISLSDYYRGGSYTTTNNTNVPTSGAIAIGHFYGAVKYTPGNITYTPGSYTFTVPSGVTTLTVYLVAGGGGGGGTYVAGYPGGGTSVGTLSATGGGGGGTPGTYNGGYNGAGGTAGSPGGITGTTKPSYETASPNPNFPGYGYGGRGYYDTGRWGSPGGGGSGGYQNTTLAVSPGQQISVSVGSGGAIGGSAYNGSTPGGNGRVYIAW